MAKEEVLIYLTLFYYSKSTTKNHWLAQKNKSQMFKASENKETFHLVTGQMKVFVSFVSASTCLPTQVD